MRRTKAVRYSDRHLGWHLSTQRDAMDHYVYLDDTGTLDFDDVAGERCFGVGSATWAGHHGEAIWQGHRLRLELEACRHSASKGPACHERFRNHALASLRTHCGTEAPPRLDDAAQVQCPAAGSPCRKGSSVQVGHVDAPGVPHPCDQRSGRLHLRHRRTSTDDRPSRSDSHGDSRHRGSTW